MKPYVLVKIDLTQPEAARLGVAAQSIHVHTQSRELQAKSKQNAQHRVHADRQNKIEG